MTRHVLGTLVLAAALGAACDEKLSNVAGPTPNLEPTLSSIQREIFSAGDASGRQACAACHTDQGRAPSGSLVLLDGRSFQSLVGAASRFKGDATLVVPGDPDHSYLIHKLEGTADIAGARMPRGGPYLSDGQILIIRRWIALGARND